MRCSLRSSALPLCLALTISFRSAHGQTDCNMQYPWPSSSSCVQRSSGSTQVFIDLQGGQNAMEPVAEPRRIRIADRSNVVFVLRGVSPLDVCSRNAGAPTANVETPVAESIVQTITGLGGLGIFAATQAASSNSASAQSMGGVHTMLERVEIFTGTFPSHVRTDAQTKDLDAQAEAFRKWTGSLTAANAPDTDTTNQKVLASKLDDATKKLATFVNADYRGEKYKAFLVADNSTDTNLKAVRAGFDISFLQNESSAMGDLQAYLDGMKTRRDNLYKRFDYGGAYYAELKTARDKETEDAKKAKGKPPTEPVQPGPTDDDVAMLHAADQIVERAKAQLDLITAADKNLRDGQAGLKTAYQNLVKLEDAYGRRKDAHQVQEITISSDVHGAHSEMKILASYITIGTDRKATSPGTFACVGGADGKTPTTTNINYSLLYQDVPQWTASVGFLATFQQKRTIGLVDFNSPSGSVPPNDTQEFAVMDQARVQLFPMAFVNYRPAAFRQFMHYGRTKEDEGIWTESFSAGFGVNPNSGTNQPEFFGGMAIGFNRFLIHPGVHLGRTGVLGGGYSLNVPFPSGTAPSTTPLIWSYHPAFSIGFSVRVAPF